MSNLRYVYVLFIVNSKEQPLSAAGTLYKAIEVLEEDFGKGIHKEFKRTSNTSWQFGAYIVYRLEIK